MLKYLKFLFAGILITFTLNSPFLYSQVPVRVSENKVIIEGKVYYLHVVKPGQTLYSISQAYRVTEKDIAIENPGVYSGLQVGQVLKIPVEVPQKSAPRIDTTKYLAHSLREGETIYSLSRTYNVSAEDIEKANSGIDVKDLSIGQTILIPKPKSVVSEEDFILHKVRRKETLYSLSKRYNVTQEDIRKYNPELQWGEMKAGQIIRIPTVEFLASQQPVLDTISFATDTTFVFEPDSLKDDLFYIDSLGLEEMSMFDYYRNMKDFNRRKLNVAYMIPFNYRIIPDTLKTDKEDAEAKEDEDEKKLDEILPASVNFLEFFEGALLALDSLRKEGVDLNVQVFDTYRSPSRVREILKSPFFRDVDLIIGPFYAYNVEIVSEFSREKRIPLISPFYDGTDLTNQNPYLFQVNPSYKTEYSSAANILSREYDKNFVFVYQIDSMKLNEIDYFKNSLIRNLENYTYTENVIIKEISYINAAKVNLSDDLSHALSKDKPNIVILPESNEAFVSTVITQLYFHLRDFDIEVFGLPYFYQFENIDFQYYHALRLSYMSPFYFSFNDPQVRYFLKKFADNYDAEPRHSTRKGCPYAMIGYDLSYYFIKNLNDWNRRFVSHLNDGEINNVLPEFYFDRNDSYGGFENKSLKLVKFTENFGILSQEVDIQEPQERSIFNSIFQFDNNNQ